VIDTVRQLARKSREAYATHGLGGLVGATAGYLTRPLALPLAVRSLRRSVEGKMSVEEAVQFVSDFRSGPIQIAPMQVHSEITALCAILDQMRPAAVLEIGTARGGTLYLFARLATDDATLVSVDLPFGQFGGGYPFWRTRLYQAFAGRSQTLTLVRADSHARQTIADVATLFGGRPVDFLFIDGDHSYAGVQADFEAYRTLVRPGGLIAFHDIVPGPDSDTGGVPAFWQDLKNSGRVRGQFRELVKSWTQGGYGIGIIHLD
jgi:predicted O-methyltransferase YrrM